jgi:2,3-dihydroxyethylbenzene 1,2-dioxygenase
MSGVSQLGYIGIGTSEAAAWKRLATEVLGMQVIPGNTASTTYLRMDEFHHRLEIRDNGRDDLDFVGWEVPNAAALHRVAQQLEDGGVRVTAGPRDEADQRRVSDLIRFTDPNGIASEIYVGRPINPQRFLSRMTAATKTFVLPCPSRSARWRAWTP